jgi:hypothetical protein
VHGDNPILADPLLVLTQVFDRLFLAEEVNRVLFLEVAEQYEIFLQDFVSWRIPAGINDENAKARRAGTLFGFSARGLRRDNNGCSHHDRLLFRRRLGQTRPGSFAAASRLNPAPPGRRRSSGH